MTLVDLRNYGLADGADAVPALRCALADCRKFRASKLVVPTGTYALRPDLAVEKHLFVSNNDSGLRRIAVLIDGLDGMEVDAQGSLFICDGQMVPFCVTDSRRITLRNFRLDWRRPFFFQGTVTAIHPEENSFDLVVLDECCYTIRRDELIFRGKPEDDPDGWTRWPQPLLHEITWEQDAQWSMWFDHAGGRPVYQEHLRHRIRPRPRAAEVAPGVVRLYDACPDLPQPGMTLVLKGKKEPNRTSPAIFLSSSSDVAVEDVTVHHAGGMGLIAQLCIDVSLRRFHVRPAPGSARRCSTTADATHFTSCRGRVELAECHFESMLDDGINVHGVFAEIERCLDAHTVLGRLMHSQQAGLIFAEPGDEIRLFSRADLQPYATLDVSHAERLNGEYFTLTTRQAVATVLRPGTAADNLTWQPELTMRRSTVRNNRARSVVLQTGRTVVIEDNLFEAASHAGIRFSGDADFWWESGPVSDVHIRHNHFSDIQGPVLEAAPRVSSATNPDARYHHNIHFENNTIDAYDGTLMRVHAVEGLKFRDNIVRLGSRADAAHDAPTFKVTASDQIEIGDNRIEWTAPVTIDSDDLTQVTTVAAAGGAV